MNAENGLGRSIIIDLNAEGADKTKEVDHRNIDSIIIKNAKYVLRKGPKTN